MNKILRTLLFIPVVVGMLLSGAVQSVQADDPTPTPTPLNIRPLMIINTYSVSPNPITPGSEFTTHINLRNIGSGHASNIIVTFESPDFFPLGTGGSRAYNLLVSNNGEDIDQSFLASSELWGKTSATLTMKVAYVDYGSGAPYNDTFTLTFPVKAISYSGVARTPTPTPTSAPVARPQLVVDTYATSVDPLQPGTVFDLQLTVRNLGNADAKGVILVLGGGTIPTDQGTPQPGVQASGSDLTNFAPLGSSNIVYIGDIPASSVQETSAHLIVNSSTQPAAYPFKLSFIYSNDKGFRSQDDQVITMLVYNLPKTDITFYRDPGMFFANEMGTIPLQVTNLGKGTVVLGNLTVTSENAEITNNTSLVGMLEPGGYFTLDANIIPFQAGPLEITATINYTDDFNQPRSIVQVITLDIQEQPIIIEPTPGPDDGSNNGGIPPAAEETVGDKILRFLLGLFGLDSAQPQPTVPTDMIPTEEVPPLGPMGPKG